MHEQERWKSVVATAAVTAVAVAYFLLTWNRTLSTYDGGYLLHNFDKFKASTPNLSVSVVWHNNADKPRPANQAPP